MKKIFTFLAFGVLAVASANAQTGIITDRPDGEVVDNLSKSSLSYYAYLTAYLPQYVNGLKSEIVVDQAKGEFYIYNPLSKLPTDSYLKGTIDAEGNVTIPTPQYIFRHSDGTVVDDYYVFRMKNVGEVEAPEFEADRENSDLKFTWKDGVLTQTDGGVLGLGFIDGSFAGYADQDIKMELNNDKTVAPGNPDAIRFKDYIIGYQNHYEVADCVIAKMGFEGDTVWLTDFVDGQDNFWVKGERDSSGKIVFPSGQYLGVMNGYYAYFYGATTSVGTNLQGTPETIYILGDNTVFGVSSDGNKYSCDDVFVVNAGKVNSSYIYAYNQPKMSQFNDAPMFPYRSILKDFMPASTEFAIGMLGFTVSPVSSSGEEYLDPSQLYYTIYINEKSNPLILEKKYFSQWIDEDTSLIPYKFNDGTPSGSFACIFNFNEVTFVFDNYSWNRLGVRTYYTGGGETHYSPIMWTDGEMEDPDPDDIGMGAIEGVAAGNNEIEGYYDLNGRRVENPEKGIYIVRTASGKTFKKVVK